MKRIKLRFSRDTFLKCLDARKGQFEQRERHTVTDGIITAHAGTRKAAERLYYVHVHSVPAMDLIDKIWEGNGSWL